MIRILSVTIYEAKSSAVLDYESFFDKKVINETRLSQWIAYLERHGEDMYKVPVKAYALRRRKPRIDIDMMKVLVNTCKVMGQEVEKVTSMKRYRVLVDVRRVICQILNDADFNPLEIEKELPFQNRVVYAYLHSMQDRFDTEPNFRLEYQAIRDEVMTLSIKNQS